MSCTSMLSELSLWSLSPAVQRDSAFRHSRRSRDYCIQYSRSHGLRSGGGAGVCGDLKKAQLRTTARNTALAPARAPPTPTGPPRYRMTAELFDKIRAKTQLSLISTHFLIDTNRDFLDNTVGLLIELWNDTGRARLSALAGGLSVPAAKHGSPRSKSMRRFHSRTR